MKKKEPMSVCCGNGYVSEPHICVTEQEKIMDRLTKLVVDAYCQGQKNGLKGKIFNEVIVTELAKVPLEIKKEIFSKGFMAAACNNKDCETCDCYDRLKKLNSTTPREGQE